jgi:hypothetical protein
MNYSAPIAAAEFRIGSALRFSFRSCLSNAALCLRMVWPWLAILGAVEVAAGFPPGFPLTLAFTGPQEAADTVLIALFLALKLMALSSIAVIWTRFLLLGEVSTGWDRLRIDRAVWRLTANMLLIWLACAGVFLLGGILSFLFLQVLAGLVGYPLPPGPLTLPLAGPWLEPPWLTILVISVFLGVMSGLPLVLRLSIKQAAIALGRDDYGLGDAWRDSSGEPFRLVIFTFAIAGCVLLLWTAAMFMVQYGWTAGSTGILASAVAAALASGLATILVTTSIAVLYGMLVEGRDV